MGREVVREGKRIQAVINAAEIKPGDYVTIDALMESAGIALYYLGAEVKAVAKVKRALANVAREQTGSGGKRRAAPADPRLTRVKQLSRTEG
jgi:hypothetical protein